MIFVVLILIFVLFIYCFKVLVVKSLKTQTFNRTINAIWNKRIFFSSVIETSYRPGMFPGLFVLFHTGQNMVINSSKPFCKFGNTT